MSSSSSSSGRSCRTTRLTGTLRDRSWDQHRQLPPPFNRVPTNPDFLTACHAFKACVTEFSEDDRGSGTRVLPRFDISIHDLLYVKRENWTLKEHVRLSRDDPRKKLAFPWYHLPANNVCTVLQTEDYAH